MLVADLQHSWGEQLENGISSSFTQRTASLLQRNTFTEKVQCWTLILVQSCNPEETLLTADRGSSKLALTCLTYGSVTVKRAGLALKKTFAAKLVG
jgi:hypothetical protein